MCTSVCNVSGAPFQTIRARSLQKCYAQPVTNNEGEPDWLTGPVGGEVRHRGRVIPPKPAPLAQPEGYQFWPIDDSWIRVTGSELPYPVNIKVTRTAQRLRVVALHIEGVTEVTSRNLREIRIGKVLEALASRLSGRKPSWSELNLSAMSDYDIAVEDWWWEQGDISAAIEEIPLSERAKQGRAPTREQLQEFVGIYAAHLAGGRRTAMTRATQQAHMARSTGYRWLELAREQGLTEGLEDE